MLRPFDALDQVGDRIELEARTQSKIGRHDLKWDGPLRAPRVKAGSNRVVHDRPERATCHPGSRTEARRDVVVQCERGPLRHIMKPAPRAS